MWYIVYAVFAFIHLGIFIGVENDTPAHDKAPGWVPLLCAVLWPVTLCVIVGMKLQKWMK